MQRRGCLIAIEGTDGSGKATQAALLKKRLCDAGIDCELISFPRKGHPHSALIEDYLSGVFGKPASVSPYAASIFYACDRFSASSKIKLWLEKGKVVIVDRYVGSNMAHQGSKIQDEDARKRFFSWLEQLEYGIFRIPKPDINILLWVPSSIGQRLVEMRAAKTRSKKDGHEADTEHLHCAEKVYLELAKMDDWVMIECVERGKLKSVDSIANDLWRVVEPLIKLRFKTC